jgi:hypothetical protein
MNLLKRFLGNWCIHRFAWPRIGANDRHYQICLLCGTAYEYDWTIMQRTDRVVLDPNLSNVLMRPEVRP